MDKIINTVNCDLTIKEYKNGIRFGTDALLLASFIKKHKTGVELGSGCGIISFLLLSTGKLKKVTGIEFDPASASLSSENADANGFNGLFSCVCCDVLDTRSHFTAGSCDLVFTNPPYLKSDTGLKNDDPSKYAAFHETTADINEFVSSAAYLLGTGGTFCAVYRPEYLSRLLTAMERNGIKPKRLRLVFPSEGTSPSLVLAEGKKHAHDGMKIEKPFNIYSDSAHSVFSPEMNSVYNEFGYTNENSADS